jgi:hypothetical protein
VDFKDKKFARELENQIPERIMTVSIMKCLSFPILFTSLFFLLKSFVCQNAEDLDLLLNELRDKRKWRINAISVSPLLLSEFKPSITYTRVTLEGNCIFYILICTSMIDERIRI